MKKTIEELNAIRAEKLNNARQTKIESYLANTADCGRFGRAKEVELTPTFSTKNAVSTANKADNYVRVRLDNGRVVRYPVEVKTNGGRVDTLFTKEYITGTAFTGAKLVSYTMEYTIKHKAGKHTDAWEEKRTIPSMLIPKQVFVDALLSDSSFLKAVNHGGIQDGIAIQVSSKRWYERLKEYANNYEDLAHEPDRIYDAYQFEGVEL